MKVKICGIRRMEDVEYINRYLPDFCGYVFAKSRRQISPELAASLASRTDERMIRVGVFVNEDPFVCADIYNDGIIDMIQLHGDEDRGYEEKLLGLIKRKGRVNKPLIRAVRVKDENDIAKASETLAGTLLLDAFSAKCEGGNGVSFDWSLIKNIEKPFFLAGGINEDNIERAVNEIKPFGVDISSGVETDGYKSEEKIRRIMERIRNYE